MDERRLLVALVLSLVLLTAYSYLFPPPRRPHDVGAPGPVASVSPPGAPQSPLPSPSPRSTPSPAAAAVPVKRDELERRVEMTNVDLSVAFTNRGARVVSWKLLHFADVRGAPEEMVQEAATGPRPLDLETDDPALDARLREALFKATTDLLSVGREGPETLRFEFAEGDLEAEKEMTLSPRGYLVQVKAAVRRNGQPVGTRILWGPGVGNPTATDREVQGYQAPQGVALGGGGVEHFPPAKLAPTGQAIGTVAWAGVESHYFAALFVPAGAGAGVSMRAVTLPAHEDGKPNLVPLVSVDLGLAGEPALLYVGPKEYREMTRAGHQLSRLVIWQMGDWIGPPIVVPLMELVRWVHARVGNYGWSIVVVTILINLVMAPFRHYSIANGMKMAKISPEMKVIQERYRKVPLMDPKRQEMQDEMAALYAKHGMSMGTQMLVGCLPLLLTMPFLMGFYRVLSVSIELRGAPFLWIPDLSHKDPLYLTPVLMGLSMFVMQKMTPTTMDPAQQRMMAIMPIVFSAMFFGAAGGLNLYWLSSNLCAIVQQAITLRILRDPARATARKRK